LRLSLVGKTTPAAVRADQPAGAVTEVEEQLKNLNMRGAEGKQGFGPWDARY